MPERVIDSPSGRYHGVPRVTGVWRRDGNVHSAGSATYQICFRLSNPNPNPEP